MDLGAPEIIVIALVLLVLFGANRLPDFARGTGRALRIFKAETKGLTSSDDTADGSSPTSTKSTD
jgi:sec-independent protein translocase protein TatA